jgi:hypothetical protein
LIRRFVRNVLGFGVWVAVGLAPFLGMVDVPLFSALLDMYPEGLRGWLLPLSGLVMGTIALVVEFVAGEKLPRTAAKRWFKRSILTLLATLVLLLGLYPFVVTRVTFRERVSSFVTGPAVPSPVPEVCAGCAGKSPAQCVAEIGLRLENIESCFGRQVQLYSALLAVLYLLLTGSFASAVGVLTLRRQQPAGGPRRPSRSGTR